MDTLFGFGGGGGKGCCCCCALAVAKVGVEVEVGARGRGRLPRERSSFRGGNDTSIDERKGKSAVELFLFRDRHRRASGRPVTKKERRENKRFFFLEVRGKRTGSERARSEREALASRQRGEKGTAGGPLDGRFRAPIAPVSFDGTIECGPFHDLRLKARAERVRKRYSNGGVHD